MYIRFSCPYVYSEIDSINYDIDFRDQFDADTEIGAKMIEIYDKAEEYYVNVDFAYDRDIMEGSPRPALSAELSLISSNTYTSSILNDNWTKAIVSGDSYTIEQAEADNRKLVEEGGGDQLLEYYQNWYKEASEAGELLTADDFSSFIQN